MSQSSPFRSAASGLVAIVVGLFTVLDMVVGPLVRPISTAIAASSPMDAVRRWSRHMPAYLALVSLLAPLAVAEPAKIFALYLIGEGHYLTGVATLGAAYLVSLMLVDTIYDGARPQLRSIAWFATVVDRVAGVRIAVLRTIRESRAYQTARAVTLRWRTRIRAGMKRVRRQPS